MTGDEAWVWDDADARVLAGISEGNEWLRSVLCTLARRGVLVRQSQPERAAAIITELSRWPFFKGGQFLFDLLEWEDFMVSGDPPPPISTVLGPRAVATWSRQLRRLRAFLDDGELGEVEPLADLATSVIASLDSGESLPPLEPGLYLFHDVAVGAFVSATRSWRLAAESATEIAREASTRPEARPGTEGLPD